MNPVRSKSCLRYFLPADTFVRIHACDPASLGLDARASLNRSTYRRAVIARCCPELAADLVRNFAELCPHDPFAGEDLLYQLCVEVNPELDIHTVRVPASAEVVAAPETLERPRGARLSHEEWLANLRARVRGLAARLEKRIIGQSDGVRAAVRAVERAAAGLGEDHKPLTSLLFVGRTGTGKTELARALAREVYGSESANLVRVDCSEFALGHEYSKLIGAPPGYVGHEHGGHLTESVRKEPHCVVLFDEIEKAHPRLHNLLLQILDEGHLTDSRGRRVDFSRALIVLTSNAGAAEIQAVRHRVGFADAAELGRRSLGELTSRALESQFAPEFLGRIGERVVFRELDRGDATKIAANLLADLARRVRSRGGAVAFAPSVARWIAERGFSLESGARELSRVIRAELETPLAERLLGGQLAKDALLRVSIRAGAVRFRAEV